MALWCKDGDLAIIIHDTAVCGTNMGRIVEVKGPVETSSTYGLLSWLIQPIRPDLFCVERQQGQMVREVVTWSSGIDHPDAGMLPLPALKHDEEVVAVMVDVIADVAV